MSEPRNVGVKKERLTFGQSLAVIIGGILGGVAGWFFVGGELSRLAAEGGRSFVEADSRGPVILGYVIMGWLAGTLVSYLLTRVWARFKRPPRHSGSDET
jgi:amino acid transporter